MAVAMSREVAICGCGGAEKESFEEERPAHLAKDPAIVDFWPFWINVKRKYCMYIHRMPRVVPRARASQDWMWAV